MMLNGLRHTLDIVKATLKAEKAGGRPLLGTAERDFLPAVLEVTETPAAPAGRALLWLSIAFFVIAVGWASIGRISVVAQASGRIVPVARLKVIQPLEAGVIRAVHVTDGQRVTAGQPLVDFDPTESRADLDRMAGELMAARLDVARLEALSQGEEDSGETGDRNPERLFTPPEGAPERMVAVQRAALASAWASHRASLASLDARVAEKSAEIRALEAEIDRADRLIPTLRPRVEAKRSLVKRGSTSRFELMELEGDLVDMEANRDVQIHRLAQARAGRDTLVAERRQAASAFRSDILAQLTEAERRMDDYRQQHLKAQERFSRQTLRAPVDGTIQQLSIHTVGGVVSPAEQLMTLVPADSPLAVEAMILNKDAGWVSEGQKVEVKVDSYPFTRYGIVPAVVKHISRDSVQDENLGPVYPAEIVLERDTVGRDGQALPLSAGMTVTAEILTGERPVIDYLLSPVLRTLDESFTER